MKQNKIIVRIILIVLLFSGFLNAEEKKNIAGKKSRLRNIRESSLPAQIVIPRINGSVTLDGRSDETAWEGIPLLSLVQMEPNFGGEPTEHTEILVAYDDHYLYMAGRLYDQEPEKIFSNSKQRDSGNPACEWFGIIIDSFNDKENALAFFTTPSGLRWDAAVFDDAQGSEPINVSWNTFWDVATARSQEGWFAEFRIPFSSLRFQDQEGQVVMGIIVWRNISRKNEWAIFPSIPPDWGFWSKFKPSKAQEVIIQGVSSRKPLYIAPYALGGFGHSFELNEPKTAYQRDNSFEEEAGLDIKYGLSSNLILDVTVNPDFAQVEADDQQVNLTRFSLFFPEKRLFFQERSSIFDFTFESTDQNKLFYSRRIGLHDGRQVRIYGGARIIGRLGSYDLGVLNMQTAPMEDLPSENLGVLRLRRQVFNENSYMGGMFTSRIGLDGSYNYVYGLDGIIRVFKDNYLTLKWAQSFSSEKKNDIFSMATSRFYLNWLRRSHRGLGYGVSLSGSGANYEPGIGFQLRHNYTRLATGTWYGWYPGEKSTLFKHTAEINSFLFIRNDDGSVETFILRPSWELITKTGYEFIIFPQYYYENVPEAFSLSGKAEIPPGKYDFFGVNIEFSTPGGNPFYTTLTLNAGSFYDGRRFSLGVSPSWSVLSDLELSVDYEFNRMNFPARSQELTTHIARIRALYMLSIKFSTMAFIQYNSATDSVSTNVRLRYNPREGIDLYFVYNESFNTNRYREEPVLPFASNRTVMLKYTYTFNL
jgi:hypothetical protein